MKKLYLIAALILSSASIAKAQMPEHPQYVKYWDKNDKFVEFYKTWEPGRAMSSMPDDEEFFISRVKPRKRFEDKNTQVDQSLSNERKFLWWVPIGVSKWNAIPSYYFNSEVFSTWSYIDHWGNWTAPYMRMPAAFADVAHKNGVSISATATMGFGAHLRANDNDGYGGKMYTVANQGEEKYIKYLQYYGFDGNGYNSEARFDPALNHSYKNLLSKASAKAKEKDLFNYSNVWYGITDNYGTMSTPWDALDSKHQDWFHYNNNTVSTHYFLNYNWSEYYLNMSKATADKFGRSNYDVYAGINMQAGSGVGWSLIKSKPVSIGVWGAHNANIIFENRGGAGSSPALQQEEYQKASEGLFTGGYNNPLKHYDWGRIIPSSSSSSRQFAGISDMIPARSTLNWDINEQAFVTYFNLGNGKFFNIKGEKAFDGEWYNIGMQDFMPTWRWWFSNNFMGRGSDNMPTKQLKARFTWDDAWFGGSSLEFSGDATKQYLQLFKTQYAVQEGYKFTIRYKLISGKGNLALTVAAKDENKEYKSSIFKITDELSYGEWQEATIEIANSRKGLNVVGKTINMLGLLFENTTSDFKVLLGELSLTKGSEYTTPEAPIIKKAISLDNNYKGADFKIVYSMDKNPRTDDKVTYNDDVKTWFYKIYFQQENQKEQFVTATTSWAAYVVGAKINSNGSRKARYGVSAVSLDGNKESKISWSEYKDFTDAKVLENIVANKNVLNKGEEITVSFEDPNHTAAKWEILYQGSVISSVDNAKEITARLDNIGVYTITYTTPSGEKVVKDAFVTVIPNSAGSFPSITELKANGKTEAIEVKKDTAVKLNYTSKNSNGSVSRALKLTNASFKIRHLYNNLGIRLGNNKQNGKGGITVTFWCRPDKTVYPEGADGTRMMDIAKNNEGWPMSEWSYFWVNYGGGHTPDYKSIPSYRGFSWTNMKTGYDSNEAREKFTFVNKKYNLEPNSWYHIAISLSYDLAKKIYVNGELIGSENGNSTRASIFNDNFDLNISRYVKFGSTFDAYLDEVRVYDNDLSDEDVKKTLSHLTDPNTEASKGLVAYFDFEKDINGNIFTSNVGGKSVNAEITSISFLGENNSKWTPVSGVQFGPSTALVEGNSYKVETNATWSANKAQFSDAQNTETSGSITATWKKNGVYPVTLKLENAWGIDTKTYNVVNVVDEKTSIDEVPVVDLSVYPNPFTDHLRLHFANDGIYSLYLYDLNAQLVDIKTIDAIAGELYTMDINAANGYYVLSVVKDGKKISTLKLQKK